VIRLRGDPCKATCQERTTNNILQGHRWLSNSAMSATTQAWNRKPEPYPSSLAVIVILALSTLETGQPLFAFSAAFWKAASSAFGTRPTTSR